MPEACQSCTFVKACGGGCAGRRRLIQQIAEPDPYCPVYAAKPGGHNDGAQSRSAEARKRLHDDRRCQARPLTSKSWVLPDECDPAFDG